MTIRSLRGLSLIAGLVVACDAADSASTDAPVHEDAAQPGIVATPDSSVVSSADASASASGSRDASSAGVDASTPPVPGDASVGDASAIDPGRADSGASTSDPDAGDAGPAPAACAHPSSLKPGDNRRTLMHGGRSRSFTVRVPTSLPPNTAVPLVLDFHGNGSSSSAEASGSGWREKGEQKAFLVAYPDGVGGSWNVGNCCGQALSGMVDDVGFARAIVSDISAAACVDPKRVYATGISNGAGLAHRLACEAADVFAAIAATSADLVTDPCKPARPISELSIRGLNDTLVAYEGGNTGSTGWYSPGAKGTLMLWKEIDRCTGSVKMSRQYCETYDACAANVEVTLCSLPNTGHILYDNRLGFKVPDVAWELFERQRLP